MELGGILLSGDSVEIHFRIDKEGLQSALRTYTYPGSATYSPYLKLFLIEDEFNASPLSLTLAGSLALSASNSKEPVYVIYKQDHNVEYGGIKLQSIKKVK